VRLLATAHPLTDPSSTLEGFTLALVDVHLRSPVVGDSMSVCPPAVESRGPPVRSSFEMPSPAWSTDGLTPSRLAMWSP
jgi:hypothetical protein